MKKILSILSIVALAFTAQAGETPAPTPKPRPFHERAGNTVAKVTKPLLEGALLTTFVGGGFAVVYPIIGLIPGIPIFALGLTGTIITAPVHYGAGAIAGTDENVLKLP